MFCELQTEQEKDDFEAYFAAEKHQESELWRKVAPKPTSHGTWMVVKTFRTDENDRPLDMEQLPYELVPASEAVDMWAVGAMLYCFGTKKSLVQLDKDEDITDGDSMCAIANWDDATLQRVLATVRDKAMRKMIGKLLDPDAARRGRIDLKEELMSSAFFELISNSSSEKLLQNQRRLIEEEKEQTRLQKQSERLQHEQLVLERQAQQHYEEEMQTLGRIEDGVGDVLEGQDKLLEGQGDLKAGQAELKAGQRRLSRQMSELGSKVESRIGSVMQMLADEGLPRVPRLVVVKPVSPEALYAAAADYTSGFQERFTASVSWFKSKARIKKFFNILIMDEGPLLPDLKDEKSAGSIKELSPEMQAALADLADLEAQRDYDPAGDIANYPGWTVELPGELLTMIAPVMMVVSKALPIIATVTTGVGVALPDLGLGGDVAKQFEEFGNAFGSMLKEKQVKKIMGNIDKLNQVGALAPQLPCIPNRPLLPLPSHSTFPASGADCGDRRRGEGQHCCRRRLGQDQGQLHGGGAGRAAD